MSWDLRKVAVAGMFGGLLWIIEVVVAMPLAIAFGAGMGSVIGVVLGPLLFVLFRLILKEPGSSLLVGFVASLLYLPLPAFGPPGFLPKIVILVGAAAAMEVIFLLFWKRPLIASAMGGIAFDCVGLILFIGLLEAFKIPGAERFTGLMVPFLIVSLIAGCLGGIAGEKIYEKIKDRPLISRL